MSASHGSANASFHAIEWHHQSLRLLDQRVLPHEHKVHEYTTASAVADAIRDMVVRGAPAIGIAAAYGYALDALAGRDLQAAYKVLAESRPTAVNLFWALERMAGIGSDDPHALVAEARRIHEEDIAANLAMGQFGASVIGENAVIYTHCNTGALATGGHGTALGVIRSAYADNKVTQVYAGETRPWLQGARLTAWELMQDNIPVSLVCDGAAAQLFKREKVDWVIVGADRITANGDVANKIGTYSLAVLAKHHGINVMVVAPTTTFDPSLASGDDIPIEQRPQEEVTSLFGHPVAPAGCKAINPSFDVTPAGLIDVIATEKGLIMQPDAESVALLLAR
ncbi:S-methyl-5-thioribose-1-phosphate isomerase [Thalassolituus marinus]|jgi:methylthioribose-1-phosphate isomerase|uniref:Methylthioribose-1-phosphate isomerase n=1 Tax=Thalassolituus marinus TaxID=671053 RepID=A0ABS7ZSK2_9GAMM|nr:S-methyl-5-thioribose-1-phosphate isomerase [Thalassolituus marinus]MCA6064744.1 S-methyl-5-thioribose-1-phosphate isomerase [Thalassolituus marinus]